MQPNYHAIIRYAWNAYDPSREIESTQDISARVSTNHVYKVTFTNKSFVIAKLSYFGRYEHFVEDHRIINVLANNLPTPYENLLARSLIKGTSLFVHRYIHEDIDVWVVFYRAVRIKTRLPRRLDQEHIIKLGKEFAKFHKACHSIRHTLPGSSKTLHTDVDHLLEVVERKNSRLGPHINKDLLRQQCDIFYKNEDELRLHRLDRIPVFVDWNIGNFSVSSTLRLFSRWDYDWFRISNRMLDFYFFSRIVSNIGDRTVFTYNIGPLMEERFLLFLQSYHSHYPLTETEIRSLVEVYRFFLLHYVIDYGTYFFAQNYSTKLQKEAMDIHFPSIAGGFNPDPILKALKL
jgi:hypothetical protein